MSVREIIMRLNNNNNNNNNNNAAEADGAGGLLAGLWNRIGGGSNDTVDAKSKKLTKEEKAALRERARLAMMNDPSAPNRPSSISLTGLTGEEQEAYNELVQQITKKCNDGIIRLVFSDDMFKNKDSAAKVMGKIDEYLKTKKTAEEEFSSSSSSPSDDYQIRIHGIRSLHLNIILSPFMGSISSLILFGLNDDDHLDQFFDALTRLIKEHVPSLKSITVFCPCLFEKLDMVIFNGLIESLRRLEQINIALPKSLTSYFVETISSNSMTIRNLGIDSIILWPDERADEIVLPNVKWTNFVLNSTTLESFRINSDEYPDDDNKLTIQNHFECNKQLNKARDLVKFYATKEKPEEGGSNVLLDGIWANAIEKLTSSPHGNTAAYHIVSKQVPKWIHYHHHSSSSNNNNNNNNNNKKTMNKLNPTFQRPSAADGANIVGGFSFGGAAPTTTAAAGTDPSKPAGATTTAAITTTSVNTGMDPAMTTCDGIQQRCIIL